MKFHIHMLFFDHEFMIAGVFIKLYLLCGRVLPMLSFFSFFVLFLAYGRLKISINFIDD